MDKYLERIAKSLEIIAEVLANPLLSTAGSVTTTDVVTAPPSIDVDLEIDDTPKKASGRAKKSGIAKKEEEAVETTAPKKITMKTVADAVRNLVTADKEGGHAAAVGVLQSFGVNRISEVKEADFAMVLEIVNGLLDVVKKKAK